MSWGSGGYINFGGAFGENKRGSHWTLKVCLSQVYCCLFQVKVNSYWLLMSPACWRLNHFESDETCDKGFWGMEQLGSRESCWSQVKLPSPPTGFRDCWDQVLQGLAQGMVSAWGNWSSVTGMRPCIASGFNGCWCSLVEKVMAPHSGTLAWRIPWTEEPGGLRSMGSWSVGHDWATSLSLFPFMHWRRKWQATPVFLPGESQGRGAWWAAIYGVAQRRTRLKWLSSSRGSLRRGLVSSIQIL